MAIWWVNSSSVYSEQVFAFGIYTISCVWYVKLDRRTCTWNQHRLALILRFSQRFFSMAAFFFHCCFVSWTKTKYNSIRSTQSCLFFSQIKIETIRIFLWSINSFQSLAHFSLDLLMSLSLAQSTCRNAFLKANSLTEWRDKLSKKKKRANNQKTS